MSSTLPPIVAQLTHNFDAWIVGSAADPATQQPRDWDVLVPFHEWHRAVACVPSSAQPNCFGGWKFESNGQSIDVWPGDLSWLMQRPQARWAWHPKSGTRIAKESRP